MRQNLRRWVEDTEDDMEHLRRYLRGHQKSAWLEHPVFQMLEAESVQLVAQSRRVECEVRDLLQIQSGVSALEETKKSIELTNLQIQEGRRVKVFTVLAFIYVPLNLATSIFGMNLQQLNASGQPLRVFLITAVLVLFVTGASWFSIDQFNDYIAWGYNRPVRRSISDRHTDFSLAARIGMICWLVYHGHFSWMRKTGTWHLILRDSRRSCQLTHAGGAVYERSKFQYAVTGLTAGRYVSKFMREGGGSQWNTLKPFGIDPVLVHWVHWGRN
ncbi:MAG: hypothetical protein Q9200_006679 [Gallowayella weberi]